MNGAVVSWPDEALGSGRALGVKIPLQTDNVRAGRSLRGTYLSVLCQVWICNPPKSHSEVPAKLFSIT